MMKKCFIVILIFTANNLFSQHFDMILTGDPVLEDIRYLSLETRRPFLSFSPPLAPGEIEKFLYSIDSDMLSQPAKDAYYRIYERLNPKARLSYSNEIFTVLLNTNITLEGKARFNEDIPFYKENNHIVPFLSFPVRLFCSSFLQLYVEPSAAVRPGNYGKDTLHFNVPSGYDNYNESMPLRAFAAAGGSFWNFQIGRDRLYWGTGHTGSLTFSDNSQYSDFARLSIFSSTIKYSVIINQLSLTLNDNLFTDAPEGLNGTNSRSVNRYYYLHRLDFILFNRVSIGIMEGVMVGNSSIELRYLNPLILFHSLFSWEDYDLWDPGMKKNDTGFMNGSILSIELSWNIIRNLSVYGQFVLNDFSTSEELKEDEEKLRPNGIGYMAGVQYNRSFNTWGSIYFLEFFYTDPYLNLLSTPFASFIQMDRFKNYYYLGYPRDTIALSFGTVFFNKDTLSFSGRLSWISSGEHNRGGLIWNWQSGKKAFNESTPTGIAENKYIFSIGTAWKPNLFLTLKTEITGIISHNNNHESGKNAAGGQVLISAGFQY